MFFTIILCFNKLYKFYVKYDKFYNKLYNKLYKLYTASIGCTNHTYEI